MANHTTVLDTNFNYLNIDIYQTLTDGVLTGYRALPHEGYVLYSTTANDVELDPDTMEEIPVTYYYRQANMPANYNFDNFHWAAVLESTVDENYIFGGGGNNNDHETV